MKFSQKRMNEKQLMTLSVTCSAVLVLLIGTFLYFGSDTLSQAKASNLTLKTELNDLENKRRDIPNKQDELEKLEEDVQDNVTKLPSESDVRVEEFIQFLATAAAGTKYEGFDPITLEKLRKESNDAPNARRRGRNDPPPKPSHFKKHAYNLKYRGTFYQFGRFLNIIESDQRFMSIEAFKMEQPKELEDPLQDIYLKIVTYTYNEKTTDDDNGVSR